MKSFVKRNMNLLDKVEFLKNLISEATEINDNACIVKIFCKLYRKGQGNFKKYGMLVYSREELIVAQILKNQEISPRTAYRWFLLLRAPEEVLSKIQNNEISLNGMIRLYRLVRFKEYPDHEKSDKEILSDIIQVMEVM